MAEHDLPGELDYFLAGREAELIDFRRDLPAHPETAYSEHRTTRRIAHRLEAAGLRPRILPKGTGLIVDFGPGAPGGGDSGDSEPVAVALRAELKAPDVGAVIVVRAPGRSRRAEHEREICYDEGGEGSAPPRPRTQPPVPRPDRLRHSGLPQDLPAASATPPANRWTLLPRGIAPKESRP